MVTLLLPELMRRDLYSLAVTPDWRPYELPQLGAVAQMAETPCSFMTFIRPPGRVGIWLLRHAWSGLVEIVCGGKSVVVDLYAEEQDEKFFHYVSEDSGADVLVTVRALGQRNPTSLGSQVWVIGLAVASLPAERGQVVTVSSSVKLIDGDWGRFAVLTTDRGIPDAIQASGTWAPDDVELFKACVGYGDAVLDVGANFGHHSVVFSELVGETGVVIAIEAQRVMYQLLNANIIINGRHNIRAIHGAASDKSGRLTLYPINYQDAANFGSLGIDANPDPQGPSAENVKAMRLDDMLEAEFNEVRIKFVKIDVQSYELRVLLGLLRCLEKHRPIVFYEVSPYWMLKSGYDYRETYRCLAASGYKFKHPRGSQVGEHGFPECSLNDKREWDVWAIPQERLDHEFRISIGRWQ